MSQRGFKLRWLPKHVFKAAFTRTNKTSDDCSNSRSVWSNSGRNCADKGCFICPCKRGLKSNISWPIITKPIISDTIRSKPIRGSAYHLLSSFLRFSGPFKAPRLNSYENWITELWLSYLCPIFVTQTKMQQKKSWATELFLDVLQNSFSSATGYYFNLTKIGKLFKSDQIASRSFMDTFVPKKSICRTFHFSWEVSEQNVFTSPP